MPMIIVLRVMSIMAVTLGAVLVAMGIADQKPPADILARALIWSIVAIIAWSQAAIIQKLNP